MIILGSLQKFCTFERVNSLTNVLHFPKNTVLSSTGIIVFSSCNFASSEGKTSLLGYQTLFQLDILSILSIHGPEGCSADS